MHDPPASPHDAVQAPDLVGAVLPGGWQVVRHVALGSFGHVYEGRHLEDGPASVAMKVLHTGLLTEPEVAMRFRREADILEAIESPHVPRLFDRGRDARRRPFFVMEFLKGRELGALIHAEGALAPARALGLTRQICAALAAAHRSGITHRDLKPENVIVQGDPALGETVKLLDFSVSKIEDIALTQPGAILGTPAYMSPQQALGEAVTVQFDVYAVGAVLYELLTGRPPFRGADAQQTLYALLTETAPPPRALDMRIPPFVEALVLRAIAKEPGERYATIEELAAAVERARGELASAAHTPSAQPAPRGLLASAPAAPAPVPSLAVRRSDTLAAPARPPGTSDAHHWALGCALLGAALVVLTKALALPSLPFWVAILATVPGYFLGRIAARSLHAVAL